jgi:hypothetical protein
LRGCNQSNPSSVGTNIQQDETLQRNFIENLRRPQHLGY